MYDGSVAAGQLNDVVIGGGKFDVEHTSADIV